MAELTDGVLTLRPPRPDDVETLLASWQDPLFARWMPGTVDRAYVEERLDPARTDGRRWVACLADGTVVGDCGLRWGEHGRDRRTNLGAAIVPGHRGGGYGERMARLAADWALGPDGGCSTVVASVTATNLPSRVAALRAGMRPEAVLTAGGDDLEAASPPDECVYVRTGAAVAGQPVLADGDLELRPWRMRDAPAVLGWVKHPDTVEFTYVPAPYPPELAQLYAGPVTLEGWATGASISFSLWLGGEIVGAVSTRSLKPAIRDVGVTAHPAFRGRGLVPRAVDAVCRWLLEPSDLPQPPGEPTTRVEWDARVDNASSIRAAQKAGFELECIKARSIVRRDGSRADVWLGVRLRP